MNVCSIWPFAQISDDFYYLGIWQWTRYFVAALFKESALITIREMWYLESQSRSRTSRSRSRFRSRRLRSRLHHCFLYSQKIKIMLSVCAALITINDNSCYFIVHFFPTKWK